MFNAIVIKKRNIWFCVLIAIIIFTIFFVGKFESKETMALPLDGKIVLIDPGHGGIDAGAVANGAVEKELNLEIAKILQMYIEESGGVAILTRTDDSNTAKVSISIDEPLNVDWDGNELLLSDILGTDSDITQRGIEDEVDRQLLRIAMEKLSKREKNIMELRFGINSGGEEKTQKQVADALGISQSYISRLEKRIIHRLKRDINKMING